MNWGNLQKILSGRPPVVGRLSALRKVRQYWGAIITQGGCVASKSLQGKRLPFEQMPALPLTACSKRRCTCQLQGLANRRCGADRRSGRDRRPIVRFASERRTAWDRRRHMHNAWRD